MAAQEAALPTGTAVSNQMSDLSSQTGRGMEADSHLPTQIQASLIHTPNNPLGEGLRRPFPE